MNSQDDHRKNANSMADAERTMSAIEGVVRILAPLQSDERQRVIQGALVILRETSGLESSSFTQNLEMGADTNLPSRARLWMKQNNLTGDQLSHVFDVSEGAATVLASGLTGKNNSEKTIKAYMLAGVAGLLSTGDPVFDDKVARSLCETLGCYDRTNHSKYMKDKGNNFIGDKDKGWKLTAPGLKSAATIVKDLAGASDA